MSAEFMKAGLIAWLFLRILFGRRAYFRGEQIRGMTVFHCLPLLTCLGRSSTSQTRSLPRRSIMSCRLISPYTIPDILQGIEAWRLRECRACQSLFWAQRRDKYGSSEKCNNVLRQRTYKDKSKLA